MKEEQQTLIVAAEQVAPNFKKTLLYHLSKLAFAGSKSSNGACFQNPQTAFFGHSDGYTCSYAIHAYKGLLTVDNALRKIAQYTSKAMLDKDFSLSQPNFKQTLFYHLAKLSLIDSSLRQSLPVKLSPFVKIKNKDQDPLHELRQQLIDSWQKNGVPMPLLSKTLFEQLILEATISNQVPTYTTHGQKPPLLVKTLYHLLSIALITSSVHSYAVPAVDALPSGGNISAGNGTISSQGNQMLINQVSDKLAINWSSYNIGANASVTYQQPSRQSVALNRVFSADPSQLYGRLNANGSVILINPNGIVVGPGANINVGAMILSAMDLSDSDFLSNNYHFTTPSADSLSTLTPQISNQGNTVAAAGGYVHLVGHNIQNQGSISAPGGTVGLLAGDTVTLNLSSDGNLLPATLTTAANADAVIHNSGMISADQGAIQLKAANAGVSGNDINTNPMANTVVIDQSGNLNSAGGSILLDGGTTGIVQHSGTLNTVNTNGLGGNISVLGDEIGLMANSTIDASGSQGGGTVLIGGNWHGAGPEHNASAVYMDPLATIKADATNNGNGGEVVLWSNNYTGFYGTISAKGGANGGDGGQVETSAQDNLQAIGTVNTAASQGKAGRWLLDPQNVTISTTGTYSVGGANPYTSTTNSSINSTSIATALATNDVIIATGSYPSSDPSVLANIASTGTGNLTGNLTLKDDIVPAILTNTTHTLTLAAGVTLTLDGEIDATKGDSSHQGRLNVSLYSAATDAASNAALVLGLIYLNNNIKTNGGDLTFATGLGTYLPSQNSNGVNNNQIQLITNGGAINFNPAFTSSQLASLATAGLTLNSSADVLVANPHGLSIDTTCGISCTAGNVTFGGKIDSANGFGFVSGSVSWDAAYLAALGQGGAASLDPNGANATYLASINSALENYIASAAANFTGAWIGLARMNAQDLMQSTVYTPGTGYTLTNNSLPNHTYTWQWVAGPNSTKSNGAPAVYLSCTGSACTVSTTPSLSVNYANANPVNCSSGTCLYGVTSYNVPIQLANGVTISVNNPQNLSINTTGNTSGAYTHWSTPQNGGSGYYEPNGVSGNCYIAGSSPTCANNSTVTLKSDNEFVGQFFKNAGYWNDLGSPANTQAPGYIYETNYAPAPLTIKANTVNFNGAVGSIHPLSTVSVTAPTININGGQMTTTGAQTYATSTGALATINLGNVNTLLQVVSESSQSSNCTSACTLWQVFNGVPNGTTNPVTISNPGGHTGGTLFLNNNTIQYSGVGSNQNGVLTLQAFNDVVLGSNESIHTISTSGKLNVYIESGDTSLDSSASQTGGGAIALSAGSSISTNGGDLLLGGPGVSSSATSCTGTGALGNATCAQNSNAFNTAVNIGGMIASSTDNPTTAPTTISSASSGGATINTGGGMITILGSSTSASNTDAGVNISGNSQITSGTGAINIIGNASNGASGIAILPVTVSSTTGTPNVGNGGTGSITLRADSMNFGLPTTPTLTGAGILNLLPYTASTNIYLGTAGVGLNIASSAFSGTNRAFSTSLTNINVGGLISGSSYPNSGTITLDTLSYGNPLKVNTSGNIVLGNAINYDGLNSTNGGNLFLNNATGSNTSHNISGSGSLSGGQVITVNTDGTGTYSGVISGTGTALTKIGAGTLTLSGANIYTGATTINAGTLAASANSGTAALGSDSTRLTAITVASGATFRNDPGVNVSNTIASLSGVGGSSAILNSGTLTTGGNNANTTFSGVLSGIGNLTKTGSGTFTLAGANIYTGATTINQGTLTAATSALGSSAGQLTPVTVASGATFNNDPGSNNTNAIASLAGVGNVMLSSGTLTTGGDNTSTTLGGTISGAGNLTKSGSGVFTLSADNSSYSGMTTINGGTIMANHANALGGANTGGINISGGTLTLNNLTLASGASNTAMLGAVNINSGGTLNSIGTAGLSGVLNVNDDSTVVALQAANGQICSAANPCSLTLGNINIAANKTLTLGNGSYLTLNTGMIDPSGANLTVNTSSSYTANGAIGGIGDVLAAVNITANGTTLQNVTANQINVMDSSTTGVNLNGILDASNSTSGTVSITAQNGPIAVGGNIKAGATSGNAIILKAGSSHSAGDVTGGDVVLANGVMFIPAVGGQVLIYTGSIANSGHAGDFTQALASSPTYYYQQDVSFSPPSAAYNIVYRQVPGVSIKFNDPNATYNAQIFPGYGSNNNLNYISTTLGNYIVTCQAASYCPTMLTGSLSVPNNALIDAGVYTVAPGTLTASNSSNSNIAFTWLPSIYTIKPKPLLIQGLTADNKIYDATNQATFNAGALSAILDAPGASTTDGNLYSGDQVSFTLNNLVGTFQNGKNVGTGPVVVTSSSSALTGASAANYVLAPQSWANLSATISPANLILSPTAETSDYGALPFNPVNITVIRGTQTVIQSNSNYSALLGGDTISNLYAEFKDFSSIRKLGNNCCQIMVAPGYVVNDGNQGRNYIVDDSAIALGSVRPRLPGATTGDASTSSLPNGSLKSVSPWTNGRDVSGENKLGALAQTPDTKIWDITGPQSQKRVQLTCGMFQGASQEVCGRKIAGRSLLAPTRSYQLPEIEFK